MKRTRLRVTAALCALVVAGGACSPPSVTPVTVPNVVVIIADDFGIDASPCYSVGADKPAMPNLESLCEDGLVFDNVWVNPQCTPTRATLMSGQYGLRTGVRQNRQVLADTTTTLFDVLRSDVPTPYSNAVIGKWHVSGPDAGTDAPFDFGVQHFAGFLTGALASYHAWDITEAGQTKHTTAYATTLLTDKAIEWVADQNGPWFLWLAYNAPHWPYHLPPSELLPGDMGLSGLQSDVDQHPRPYFLAMAQALDSEIGRFLESIDAAVRENTTFIFVGDNGTAAGVVQAPFDREHAKTSMYEGGIRVPLVVAGRGVERPGEREDSLINGVDLPATIAQLAGYEGIALADGVSFLDALSDPSFRGREFIYTDGPRVNRLGRPPGWAIRDVRYKLIHYDSGDRELFDLSQDPWEQHELLGASTDPELRRIVEALERAKTELTGDVP